MTASDDDLPLDPLDVENDAEEAEKKKKKGKGEASGAGRSMNSVSPAAIEYLTKVGATLDQITRILKDWAFYKADALTTKLFSFFGPGKARASAQPAVLFEGKDYGLIHSLFTWIKNRVSPAATPRRGGPDDPMSGGPK